MKARRLLYAVIPLLILGVGGELALRAAGWPKPAVGKEFTHKQVFYTADPSLHLDVFPHKETGASFRVSTDPNGLRAPIHPVERAPNVTRVMTLGCSTTFGWGVDDEQSYPARLEAILQEQGQKVEVINGGQPGYTSFQGLWLWDKALASYKPDLVIFGYVVQDARMAAYTDRSQAILQNNADFLKQNFLYNFRLYLGLREVIDGWRIRSKERKEGGEEGSYRVPPEEYAANIRAFQEKVTANGGQLLLFGYPLEREGYTSAHRAILKAASEELGLPWYDPQPEFERYTAAETLYFPQDRGHANAAGNDRIAQGVAQYLIAHQLLAPVK